MITLRKSIIISVEITSYSELKRNDSHDISKNNNITHDRSLSPEAKPPIKLAKKNWPINFELPKSFPPIVMAALEKRVYMEKKARSKFIQALYDAICRYTMWVNFFLFQGHCRPSSTVTRLTCVLPEVLKLVVPVISSCIVFYFSNKTTLVSVLTHFCIQFDVFV